jgi:hypothetical protein
MYSLRLSSGVGDEGWCRFTNEAAGETRKRTAAATSVVVPHGAER